MTRIGPSRELLEEDLGPFRAACEAGVAAVMLGATVIESIDPTCAASVSRAVVTLLREQLGFTGVVVSDDLEMKSIEAGRGIVPTVELALQAGVDLLLLPGGAHALELAEAIVEAVEAGRVDRGRVAEAAARVRHLAAGRRSWPLARNSSCVIDRSRISAPY